MQHIRQALLEEMQYQSRRDLSDGLPRSRFRNFLRSIYQFGWFITQSLPDIALWLPAHCVAYRCCVGGVGRVCCVVCVILRLSPAGVQVVGLAECGYPWRIHCCICCGARRCVCVCVRCAGRSRCCVACGGYVAGVVVAYASGWCCEWQRAIASTASA